MPNKGFLDVCLLYLHFRQLNLLPACFGSIAQPSIRVAVNEVIATGVSMEHVLNFWVQRSEKHLK